MTYDEAIAELKSLSAQFVDKPDNTFAQILAAVEANHWLMIRRWKNWRNYAKDLWGLYCEDAETSTRYPTSAGQADHARMRNWQKECHKTDTETTNRKAN